MEDSGWRGLMAVRGRQWVEWMDDHMWKTVGEGMDGHAWKTAGGGDGWPRLR